MNEQILMRLLQTTKEESAILAQKEHSLKHFYSKPGRFLIERRRISNIVYGFDTAPISLRAHPRFCEFPLHSHDFIEIMFVCQGSITHLFDGTEVRLEEYDFVIIGKGTDHAIKKANEQDIGINLLISTDLFEKMLNTIRQSSGCAIDALESMLRERYVPFCIFHAREHLSIINLMEILISEFLGTKSPDLFLLEQTVILLLHQLASLPQDRAEFSDAVSYENSNKKKLLTYLRSSYSTATLTEAADMMGLAPTYLSRWVRKNFGISFKELLMNERFNTARELLQRTDMPIGEILYHIGYENSSYFHKEFKKRFGMTPKAYRKQSP